MTTRVSIKFVKTKYCPGVFDDAEFNDAIYFSTGCTVQKLSQKATVGKDLMYVLDGVRISERTKIRVSQNRLSNHDFICLH